jgi:predicted ester cyclase
MVLVPEGKVMFIEDNKARIRQSIEAINNGDIEGFFAAFTTTCVFHDRPSGGTNTFESARQNAVAALAAFPDLHMTIEDLIAEGEKIVVRYTYHATHAANVMGTPPTGKQVTWTGISILHRVNGKVVEDWANTDLLGFMQQIDAIPKCRSRVEKS